MENGGEKEKQEGKRKKKVKRKGKGKKKRKLVRFFLLFFPTYIFPHKNPWLDEDFSNVLYIISVQYLLTFLLHFLMRYRSVGR